MCLFNVEALAGIGRLHPYRIARRHCHHRHPRGDAFAGAIQSQSEGETNRLPEQSASTRSRHYHVSRRVEKISRLHQGSPVLLHVAEPVVFSNGDEPRGLLVPNYESGLSLGTATWQSESIGLGH